MIASLIRSALVQRIMVLAAALALTAAGVWAFRGVAIDAFPDISATQVQIVVKAPGMSPTEVEGCRRSNASASSSAWRPDAETPLFGDPRDLAGVVRVAGPRA